MENYLITFTNEHGEPLGSLVTLQPGHWEACEYGWNNAPEGTDDFQVYSEEQYTAITGGCRADSVGGHGET